MFVEEQLQVFPTHWRLRQVDNVETTLYGKLVSRREDIDEPEEDICP